MRFFEVARIFRGMSTSNAWEELQPSDLPSEDLQWLANTHGMEAALGLWKRCQGTSVRFPGRLPRTFALRFLGRYWDGSNTKQMARALHISERTVQEYLQASRGTRRPVRDESQLALFEP